jgi:hypothetical protein
LLHQRENEQQNQLHSGHKVDTTVVLIHAHYNSQVQFSVVCLCALMCLCALEHKVMNSQILVLLFQIHATHPYVGVLFS